METVTEYLKLSTIDRLKHDYEVLINEGYYNKGAYLIADFLGLKMYIKGREYKKHFDTDEVKRYVFKIQLKKGGREYTFDFGQSISEGDNEPTLYDVLSCLQKYDSDTFEDFCDKLGYDNESRSAEKTYKAFVKEYKAVLKEYKAMERLFTSDELELLKEVQ